MANGTIRQVIRRLIPRRIRWLAKAVFRVATGLYFREVTRHVRDMRGQMATQGAQIEAQGQVMDLMMRRLHNLEEEVAPLAQRLPRRTIPFNEWEPWLTDYVLTQGDIFLDIGANTGQYSATLAPGFRTVIAFEPNAQARDKLCSAVAGLDNVTLDERAVYNHTGVLKLYLYADHAHTSPLPYYQGGKAGALIGEIAVSCVKLDDIEFDGKIDFVKVDTEGAEAEIIAGAINTIAKHKPQLLLEIHSTENGSKIQDMLGEWGYQFTIIRHPAYNPEDPLWEEHYYWLSSKAG